MPRVHHLRARKPIPSIGVVPGDMYYKWRMRQGLGSVKRVSKTPPKPSQLTLSPFLSAWRGFGERIEELELDDTLHSTLQEIAGELRELGEECTSSRDNMPEGLQQGETGQLLETRAEKCEEWASALEQLDEPDEPNEEEIKGQVEREDGQSDADYEGSQNEAWEAAQSDYEEELRQLRDDAIGADPGEE